MSEIFYWVYLNINFHIIIILILFILYIFFKKNNIQYISERITIDSQARPINISETFENINFKDNKYIIDNIYNYNLIKLEIKQLLQTQLLFEKKIFFIKKDSVTFTKRWLQIIPLSNKGQNHYLCLFWSDIKTNDDNKIEKATRELKKSKFKVKCFINLRFNNQNNSQTIIQSLEQKYKKLWIHLVDDNNLIIGLDYFITDSNEKMIFFKKLQNDLFLIKHKVQFSIANHSDKNVNLEIILSNLLYNHHIIIDNTNHIKSKDIETKIHYGLRDNNFFIEYQPKFCLKSQKIVGAEALLRLYDPETKNILSPNIFIPIAEKSDLIFKIGDWILQKACEQNYIWLEKGFSDHKIAVNLSFNQFKQNNYAEKTAYILWQTKMPAKFLELELTESAVIDNLEKAQLTLKVLKIMGLSVAIDDFGTGYTALNYLRQLPIDTLKLDKSFIQDFEKNKNAYTLIEGIISLGQNLSLNIVAEGIETQKQMDILRKLNCNIVQGYLISKPLSSKDYTNFLKQNI